MFWYFQFILFLTKYIYNFYLLLNFYFYLQSECKIGNALKQLFIFYSLYALTNFI